MAEKEFFGRSWSEIQALQQRRDIRPKIDTSRSGDFGADPIGDGMYRMAPSGDVVDASERDRRLSAVRGGAQP